jgi:Leucine-rich repeat (LRR) protein
LERLANLTNLGLSFNEIHDLTPLRGLKKLKVLHLIDKRFYLPDNPSRTFAEIDKLRQTLPNCVIHHNARK